MERSFVAESRKDTDTPAHEVGHVLNLGHFSKGLMKEIDKAGTITRELKVTVDYVQQIIDYAINKTEGYESTAPEGGEKAQTTLTNPQGNKVEGNAVEIKK